jgi:D-3-phosphoglycerate dehydrogenase
MPKWTVVVTELINEAGIDLLKRRGVNVVSLPAGAKEADLMRVAPDADAFITRGTIKVTREMMVASPRLKAVGVHGIGCDHIDLKAAKELSKVVVNTPDALTVTVSELTIGLILSMTRRITAADKATRNGGWTRKYGDLIGVELMGKTVGVVGMGRIGAAVAKRLKPFDVKLLYWNRTQYPALEKEIGMEWAELPDLLKRSDIISLHVPGTPETKRLIGAAQLRSMKRGAMLVNMARGIVVDESALIEALKSGQLSGVALDVFEQEPIKADNPLLAMDNVTLTPHLGACALEAMQRMATQVAEGVLDVLDGRTPQYRVA